MARKVLINSNLMLYAGIFHREPSEVGLVEVSTVLVGGAGCAIST